MTTHFQLLGDLDFSVIPGPQQRSRFLQGGLVESFGPAADTSPPTGGFEAGIDPLA